MSNSKASIRVAFVALFVLSVLAGCSSPDGGEVAQVSVEEPQSQFKPWDETLALTSPFPRFIFLPLNNPAVVPASMAPFMEDDDIVAGVVVEGQARAYPQWVLVAYHVVNDTIGNSPVLLAHCEICSGTSSFTPMVEDFEGRTLSFQIHGIAKGTFSVYDYQTQTVWSPFTGRTMEGALHPSRMDRIPLIVEPWGDWKKRFPDTEFDFVAAGNPSMGSTPGAFRMRRDVFSRGPVRVGGRAPPDRVHESSAWARSGD